MVLGEAGEEAGFGMRRGTLLLGRMPQSVSSGFRPNGQHSLSFLTLLDSALQDLEGPMGRLRVRGIRVHRSVGDRACGGQGEILVLTGRESA